MTITVSRLRASLLWTWSGAELMPLDGGPSPYWAGDRHRYTATFDALRSGAAAPRPVTLPWDGAPLQRFWSYYTAKAAHVPKHQSNIDAAIAFRHLMPLRADKLMAAVVAPEGTTLRLEAFLLPVGLGLALNLDVCQELVLDAAVDRLVELCTQPVFTTVGSAAPLTLAGVRDSLRAALHAVPEVPEVKDRIGSSEPFGLVTVLAAQGVDPAQPMPPDEPVQRALYGLASRSVTWRQNALPAWAASVMPASSSHPAVQACYATRLGRCIWHPASFDAAADPMLVRGLNCYHRNLSFGALQVQTLTQFLRLVQDRRAAGAKLSVATQDLAGFASGVLGRLYGKAAYHAWSVRRWIDDDPGAKALIDAERQLRGLVPLA